MFTVDENKEIYKNNVEPTYFKLIFRIILLYKINKDFFPSVNVNLFCEWRFLMKHYLKFQQLFFYITNRIEVYIYYVLLINAR